MKKLLLLTSIILCAHFSIKAQSNKSVATPTVVTDTLNYYFNKQVFKIANAQGDGYPFYKSSAATGTNITHIGSVFLNSDPNLKINGLEARVSYQLNSNALSVPVKMYLHNVDANLTPISPPIDSVSFIIGQSELPIINNITYPTGHSRGSSSWIGTPGPKTVSGNFAILIRNMSLLAGDTARIYRTASLTRTNTASTAFTRMGEGFGIVKQGGQFYKTTNFNHSNFGYGTDYEFCVAPRVTYTLEASHLTPPKVNSNPVDTVMCWEPLTFTNTSTSHFTNRFFNLNEFYRHLYPYASTPPNGFSNDSAISWFFDDEDFDYPALRPNIILKNNATTATKYYDTAGCFTECSMRARLKKMTVFGTGAQIWGNVSFSVCVGLGNCDLVGLNDNSTLNKVTLFPNPTANSNVTIRGLNGANTILIYDLLGQLLAQQITRDDEITINLKEYPKGNYFIKVVDERQYYKTFKLISQKE